MTNLSGGVFVVTIYFCD